MGTLRVTNIEAKSDSSSPSIHEKVSIRNSNEQVIFEVDGKNSPGVGTVFVGSGIVTATTFTGNVTGTATKSQNLVDVADSVMISCNPSGVEVTGIATFTGDVVVGAGKSLRLFGASSGYTEIVASAGSASTTFTLPANGGSASQYLQTDGAGILSWQTVTSGLQSDGPAFYVDQSASTSLTHNTFHKLEFDDELFDTNNCYDNTTNYRFTPTVAGYYYLSAGASMANTASDPNEMILYIRKNGSTIINAMNSTRGSAGGYSGINVSGVAQANGSSDYFEVFFYYWDTDSENFSTDASRCFFTGCLVRGS